MKHQYKITIRDDEEIIICGDKIELVDDDVLYISKESSNQWGFETVAIIKKWERFVRL